MRALLPILLCCLGGCALVQHGAASTPRVTHWHARAGGWRLDVDHETFRDATACRLGNRRHGLGVVHGALAIATHDANVMARAAWRVDDGALHHTRDDLPALIAAHVPIDRGGMDDPTDRRLWIPLERLDGAHRLVVQDYAGGRVRSYDLGALATLRQTAAAHGCADAGRFIE